jgi:hypothetical protein
MDVVGVVFGEAASEGERMVEMVVVGGRTCDSNKGLPNLIT